MKTIPNRSVITRKIGVCGGRPAIKNTRLAVHVLIEYAMYSLTQAYPHLKPRQLKAVFDYFAKYPEQIYNYIRQERATDRQLRRTARQQIGSHRTLPAHYSYNK